jgi:adenosylmethionine-8-amino-7-oxononanoate aminotransferase
MANPLACAVAGANLGLLATGDWARQVAGIEIGLLKGLSVLRGRPGVADVRVIGAVGVVEMDDPIDLPAATQVALDHGVWLRPFGRLLYTMPPYICTADEIASITTAMAAVVEQTVPGHAGAQR